MEPQVAEALLQPQAPTLTERARALYEDSVVPVTEIARLAGVTESTIYKRARKENWKCRYRWVPDAPGARPRWRPLEGFASGRGAGGRFIRRADIGKPFATGIKATDPEGAAQAAAACADAQVRAQAAQAKAARDKRRDEELRALEALCKAIADINVFRRKRDEEEARAERFEERMLPREGCTVWRDGRLVIARPERDARAEEREQRRVNADAIEHALWVAAEIALARVEASSITSDVIARRAKPDEAISSQGH